MNRLIYNRHWWRARSRSRLEHSRSVASLKNSFSSDGAAVINQYPFCSIRQFIEKLLNRTAFSFPWDGKIHPFAAKNNITF
jgi:hypothetical protein